MNNYYHDLLTSYSKLKKRSLILMNEEEGKKEEETQGVLATPNDLFPLLTQNQLQHGGTTKYSHPQDKGKVISVRRNGDTLTGNFGVGGQKGKRYTLLRLINVSLGAKVDTRVWQVVDQAASLYSNLKGWPALEEWFSEAGPTGEELGQVANDAATQKAALDQAREDNATALDPYFEDFGAIARSDETPDEAAPTNDLNFFYWMEKDKKTDEVDVRKEWVGALKDMRDKLVDDTDIPLQRKMDSLDNLKEMIRLGTSIKRHNWEDDAATAGVAGDLRTLHKQIGQTGRGEFALLVPEPGDGLLESDILLFGHKDKRALKGLRYLKATLNQAAKKYNEVSQNLKIQEGWDRIQVQRSGTPGDDAQMRGMIDEALMGAAGSLHILGLAKTAGSNKEHPHYLSSDRHTFLVDKIQKEANTVMKGQTLEKIASYLDSGAANNRGEGVSTLLSETAGEFTQAIKDRMGLMFGEDFPADDFVDELSQDVQKAVALVLALRSQTIQHVLGKVQPIASVVMGGRGERKTGRKVDNGFFFRPDQQKELADHINKQLGKGRHYKSYMETEKMSSFIKKELLEIEDLPEDYKDPVTGELLNPDEEITLLRLSLKTHNNHSSDSSQGSCRASASVPESATKLEGIALDAHNAIKDTVSQESADELKKFHDTLRKTLWAEKDGKNTLDSRQQNEAYWDQAKVTMNNMNDDERANFGKSLAIWFFMVGGGSRAPQLNVVSYTGEADYTLQSDHEFRKTFLSNIKDGTWTVNAPKNKGSSSLITIRDPKSDRNVIKIKGRGERNDVWKTAWYQKELLKKQNERLFIGPLQTSTRDDNSTIFREFLQGQAKLIQTLLVTH